MLKISIFFWILFAISSQSANYTNNNNDRELSCTPDEPPRCFIKSDDAKIIKEVVLDPISKKPKKDKGKYVIKNS